MTNKYGIEVTKNFIHGDPAMIAEIPGSGFAFIWHGGAYIDCIRKEIFGSFMIGDTCWEYTDENINVWDYDAGSASIKFGDSDAMITVLTEWMDS